MAIPVSVVLCGVAGCGKTTVGRALAAALECTFVDGDDVHPEENVSRMRQGLPLTDEHRRPWLAALRRHLEQAGHEQRRLVVACSALRQAHRDQLAAGLSHVTFVQLAVPLEVATARLEARRGHFFPAALAASQFAAQEPLAAGRTLDGTRPVDELLAALLADPALA